MTTAAALLLVLLSLLGGVGAPPGGAAGGVALPQVPLSQLRPGDYYNIPLYGSQHARGASGEARVRLASSPFGVAATVDGHVILDVEVTLQGLPAGGEFAVWAATPDLDEVVRIGTVSGAEPARGQVHFNKFLLFVTADVHGPSAALGSPPLVRGISRSGRMQSMLLHSDMVGP